MSATTELAKPDAPATIVKKLLESQSARVQAVLPPHMTPAKVIQTCSMLVYDNEQLQKCDPHTVVKAVLEGCECGLSFSKASGEAYIVPFKNRKQVGGKWVDVYEATFIPGYRGLTKLIYQSGFVARIHADVVYEGEPFLWRQTGEGLEYLHEPLADRRGRRVISVYAIAWFTNGHREGRYWAAGDYAFAELPMDGFKPKVDPALVDQACKLRLRSKAPNSPAWVKDWAEMVMKGPIRNLAKMLPKSERLIAALEADDRQYELDGRGSNGFQIASGNHGSRTAALAASLRPTLPAPEAPAADEASQPDADPGSSAAEIVDGPTTLQAAPEPPKAEAAPKRQAKGKGTPDGPLVATTPPVEGVDDDLLRPLAGREPGSDDE